MGYETNSNPSLPCRAGGVCPPDLELLRGIASGSEESFRLLFERWSGRLGRFLTRATGSRQTGEDLLQEAFLRILRAAPRFEPRGEVNAWIYQICANLAYSYWRSERRSPFRSGGTGDLAGEAAAPDHEGPEARRLGRSFAEEAYSIVDRLPENQRIVFLMKVDQDLTYEEIADVLRCPVGTVKSRLHHAIRRLRAGLREWEDAKSAETRIPSSLRPPVARGLRGIDESARRSLKGSNHAL